MLIENFELMGKIRLHKEAEVLRLVDSFRLLPIKFLLVPWMVFPHMS